jgi:hypothetical protein
MSLSATRPLRQHRGQREHCDWRLFPQQFLATRSPTGSVQHKDFLKALVLDSVSSPNSSRRYEENIQGMADASSRVLQLRPVTYNYIQPYADGSKPIDYGLIAEEVAEVYPDLVVKNSDGQIQTVQYQKLTPMLLNEVQKLNTLLAAERERADALQCRLQKLEEVVKQLVRANATQD